MFADDIVLLAENEENLQDLIDAVSTWCNKNQMAINVNKTKIMHVRKKNKDRSSFVFNCNNRTIDYCNEYKYLGVFLLTMQLISC